MAFPASCVFDAFKVGILTGAGHNFTDTTGDQFTISLHTNSATFTSGAANFAALDAEVTTSG